MILIHQMRPEIFEIGVKIMSIFILKPWPKMNESERDDMRKLVTIIHQQAVKHEIDNDHKTYLDYMRLKVIVERQMREEANDNAGSNENSV